MKNIFLMHQIMSITGATFRICHVVGCSHSDYNLHRARSELCQIHGIQRGDCPLHALYQQHGGDVCMCKWVVNQQNKLYQLIWSFAEEDPLSWLKKNIKDPNLVVDGMLALPTCIGDLLLDWYCIYLLCIWQIKALLIIVTFFGIYM